MASKEISKEKKKPELLHAEKEFYVLEITNLNRKIARLKTLCAELQNENEDCKKRYKILDQDRSDVIAYLKRSLTQKQDEIIDLTNRLEATQKEKKGESSKYEVKIQEMEHKYTEMSNSLTAEITLLNGKLNSLEEFKIQRDSMMKQYLNLEEKLKEETERHLEQESIIENQSLIQKESLRTEIDKRLLNLSILLQKDTQYKIAETTQNIVRENIALNNELNLIIVSWQKLFDQNETLKSRLKTLSNEIDVSFEIKDNLITKHVMQKQIINCLITKYEEMMSKFDTLKNCELRNNILEQKLIENDKIMKEAVANYKKIESMHYILQIELSELKLVFDTLKHHNFKLEERIKDAVIIIKDVIGLGVRRKQDPFGISEQDEYNSRNNLLNTLLKLFDDMTLFISEEAETPNCSQDSILATNWREAIISEHLLPCASEPSTPELTF